MIDKVTLFRSCSPAALLAVTLQMQTVIVSPGEYLVVEGELGSEMFFVRTGRLVISVTIDENVGRDIKVVLPGAYVGEMSFFGEATNASIRADGYGHVEKLTHESLRRLCNGFPEILDLLTGVVMFKRQMIEKRGHDEPTQKKDSPGGQTRSRRRTTTILPFRLRRASDQILNSIPKNVRNVRNTRSVHSVINQAEMLSEAQAARKQFWQSLVNGEDTGGKKGNTITPTSTYDRLSKFSDRQKISSLTSNYNGEAIYHRRRSLS